MTFGDDIVSRSKIRFRSDGSRVSDQEILERYGSLALRLVRLQEAMERRVNETFSLPYPPKVFIAYKWGSKENRDWVERLANGIRKRGYEPVLDSQRNEVEALDAEEFVSRIWQCAAMLIVITRDYLEFLGNSGKTTWVFDELQLAFSIQKRRELKIISLLREEGLVPSCPGLNAYTVEMWRSEEFDDRLDKLFRYNGPKLSRDGKEAILIDVAKADAHIKSGESNSALRILKSIVLRYPFVRDAWLRQITLLVDNGQYSSALAVAEEARGNILPHDESFKIEMWRAKLLRELGDTELAVRAAINVINETRGELERWEAHRLVGNVLDDAGEHLGGRNHLLQTWRGTRDLVAGNDLGVAYMRMGCWDAAQKVLDTVLVG